jgi:hypothetical protein
MPPRRVAVCLEVTPEQAVASALDWPGWCRAGRDEGAALAALAGYAARYAPVAAHAGVSFPATVALAVIERVPGGPATAFAAPECRRPFPHVTAGAERAAVTPGAAQRLAGLLTAAWAAFDQIAAASPAELRKGPARWRPGPGPDHRPRDRRRHGLRAQARDQAQAASHRRHRRDRNFTASSRTGHAVSSQTTQLRTQGSRGQRNLQLERDTAPRIGHLKPGSPDRDHGPGS